MTRFLVAVLLFVGLAGGSQATTISEFRATTNDGWFSITQEQADYFGASSATGIVFFRVREGRGQTFDIGDTFDQATILNSFNRGASSILGILNGESTTLTYTGGRFAPLGTTTIGADNSYFRAVGLLMSSSGGNAVARNATFNVTETSLFRGALDFTIPTLPIVPLPAAVWMLLAGLGGLVALSLSLSRRRKPA